MKKITLPLLLLAICLAGCRNRVANDGLPTLNIEAAIDNPRPFDLFEIAEEIAFIPLDESIPLGEIYPLAGLQPSDSGFYFVDASFAEPVKSFDRTGRFISTQGHRGRGPNETLFIAGITSNDSTGEVYIDGGFQVVAYDAAGRMIARNDSIATYGMLWHEDRLLVPRNPSLQDKNAYTGERIPFIDLFDRELKRVGSIHGPNPGPFVGIPAGVAAGGEYPANSPPFLSDNGTELIVKQGRNDTLYYYNKGVLKPAWRLDLGRYAPPAEVFGLDAVEKWSERYFSVDNVWEGDRYIIVTANNRQGQPLRRLIFERSDPSGGFSATGPSGRTGLFVGGVAFTPCYIRDNRLVGYMQALDIVEGTDDITDPDLKTIAAAMQEDSNPVIVVATLKKR